LNGVPVTAGEPLAPTNYYERVGFKRWLAGKIDEEWSNMLRPL
jgi:hypothetical protein